MNIDILSIAVHTPASGTPSRAAVVPASAPGPARFTAPPDFGAASASVSASRRREKKQDKASKKGKAKAKPQDEVPDIDYDDMFDPDD